MDAMKLKAMQALLADLDLDDDEVTASALELIKAILAAGKKS